MREIFEATLIRQSKATLANFTDSSDDYPECETDNFTDACEVDYKPLENPQLLRDNLRLLTPLFGAERRTGGAQRGTCHTVHQSPMGCAASPHVL